ncbi:MAG: VCBS domain-containing protein, partial [bacterium]
FYSAKAFNQNIGSWDVSKVTTMHGMLYDADAFNHDLNNWNTTATTSMSYMFSMNDMFNRNIASWNTQNVTNMSLMFNGATSFNQNIGSWNVANVTTMANMLNSSGIKANNYDSILTGWAAQTVKANVTLGASGLKYSSVGQTGRTTLVSSPYTWTISGDSLVTQGSATADTATALEAGGTSNGTAGTNPTGNVLTNDTGPGLTVVGVTTGTVGSASGSVGSSVTGTYGSINVSSTGAYTYPVDNTNATVQALRTTANTLTDVYTYSMTDTNGYTKTTQITVTIQGANDAPVGVDDTNIAVEAGGLANGTAGTNPTGNVLTNDTDVDAGDTKTVSGVAAGTVGSASGSVATAVTGSYGSINIAANGSYTYTVDNTNATVQALRTSGQTITDIFTYTVSDTGGLTSTTQITVTIQGANDAPVAVTDTATAVEAGGLANGTAGTNPTGNVLTNDTDPDSAGNGETKTVVGVLAGTQASAAGNVAASVTGTYGSIAIAANGAYTYMVDNSHATVQALRTSGNTLSDVFTYT